MRPVQSLDRERGEESLEIPGGLSTRLGQRTGGVRPQGMVHVFDAERVEIKYFSKECETGSRGLEPFFESGCLRRSLLIRPPLVVRTSMRAAATRPRQCRRSPQTRAE